MLSLGREKLHYLETSGWHLKLPDSNEYQFKKEDFSVLTTAKRHLHSMFIYLHLY